MSVPDALPRGVLGGHIRTVWDVIIDAVVPSGADSSSGASGCPVLELRGLEPLTSSMPWNGPPSVFSAWLQLALTSRFRLPLGPISAETKTHRLLSSVTTHGLPEKSATCNATGSARRISIRLRMHVATSDAESASRPKDFPECSAVPATAGTSFPQDSIHRFL